MKCPTNCNGSDEGRQQRMTSAQLEQIPEVVAKAAQGRCHYCGSVYDTEGRVYGFLDSEIRGPGWHSLRFPHPNSPK